LKVVRLGEMDSDQSVESVREAQLLSQLNNPYIVKVKISSFVSQIKPKV